MIHLAGIVREATERLTTESHRKPVRAHLPLLVEGAVRAHWRFVLGSDAATTNELT